MPRKAIKGVFTQSMDIAGKPIVEDTKLPNMDDVIKKPIIKTAKIQKLMDDSATTRITSAKPSLMTDFVLDTKKEKPIDAAGLPEQKARAVRSAVDDSYVVLRMRVQNGEMTVIGSKKVDGPLANYDDIVQSGLTYEATLENARLAIGSVADFGERRSYPRPGEHEHNITNVPSFDFNLKIPSSRIVAKDLPKLKISLYRFKEPLIQPKLGMAPLDQQFEREARIVAELNGINVADLSADVKSTIKKAFAK
jgi:hypothetical protein